MDSEIVETITDWDQSPFSDGYRGLRALAEREFTGAVTQGTAWGFMLNGRLIGIEDGSLSTFDGADGTAYDAPSPALPLLYAMQSKAEKQAQYYSNKKSIAEADKTLRSGSFTGFIELSENVLSGEYYTVYYGGKSMSAAFVGNSRKLLTDEEAFERADDEVGIYTVYAADLEVIELPEAATEADDNSTPGAADAGSSAEPAESDATTAATATASDSAETAADSPSTGKSDTTASSSTESATDTSPTAESATDTSPTAESATDTPSTAESATDTPSTEPATDDSSAGSPTESTANGERTGNPAHDGHSSTASTNTGSPTSSSVDQQSKSVFNDEAEWRDSKTIPSLDPRSDSEESTQHSQSRSHSKQQRSSQQNTPSRRQLQKRLKRAEKVMQKAEAQHEKLVEERDTAQAERDAARQELDTVRTKLSAAESEIERLESQLESGSTDTASTVTAGGQTLSTDEALAGTNLLVRYASKGDGTLEDAISGDASQEDIMGNLRIEPHTTFDREELSVDGQPFETFLEGRIELAFVRWLAEEFLFDIQQTGNTSHLKGIYETLPAINRAELQGTVSLGTDEDGEDMTTTFDLVVRDKRDRPLFVADFNESKQPVGSGMVDSLVRHGSEIIQRNDSFAASFAVTTSYYEGAALDAAADATGGGLLSASRGKSFVYISRKQGFHLCLVERLGDTFDLHVPEL